MRLLPVLAYADVDRCRREFAHVVRNARGVHIDLPADLGGDVELVVGAVTTEHLNRDECAIAEAATLTWPAVRLYSPKARAIVTVPPDTVTRLPLDDE